MKQPLTNLIKIGKEAAKEIYPRLFVLVGIQKQTQKIVLYNKVHYTSEEAIQEFKITTALKTGTIAELWVIKIIASISIEDLEKDFAETRDKAVAISNKSKNDLMKKIIKEKNVDLLQQSYNKFTDQELVYIHEKII